MLSLFVLLFTIFVFLISAEFHIIDSTFHTNPNVETGAFDVTITFTCLSLLNLPKYYYITPSPNGRLEYLRGHFSNSQRLIPIRFDHQVNALPDNWQIEPIYIRIGTSLIFPFPGNIISFPFIITFCVIQDECLPQLIQNDNQSHNLAFPTFPPKPSILSNSFHQTSISTNNKTVQTKIQSSTQDEPTYYQLTVQFDHDIRYSVASKQYLTQWILPPPPIPPIPPIPSTSEGLSATESTLLANSDFSRTTMFEMLLKDAFLDTETIEKHTKIDFFDVKLIGLYYFSILTPLSELETKTLCYFNQVPVRIFATQSKTRQIRVYIPNSVSQNDQDGFSFVRQIRPKMAYRAQFTCSQQVTLSNDWQSHQFSQDIPLFVQIQLGYKLDFPSSISPFPTTSILRTSVSIPSISSTLTTKTETTTTTTTNTQFILYPDRFTHFYDPSKLHPYEIPPPRCRNLMTEWNPLQSVLTTYFMLEYSNTTGALSGPSLWDTREYLFYHTDVKLQIFFDDMVFDLEHFTPSGSSQIQSENGYAALYVLPDVGFEENKKDWGPLMTITNVYQNGLTGSPSAEFGFRSSLLDSSRSSKLKQFSKRFSNSSPSPSLKTYLDDNFFNQNHQGIETEYDPPQCIHPSPFYRDTPLSPYHSLRNFTLETLPWATIPVHVIVKWHLPNTRFLSTFPQWSAHISFEHTNPIDFKESSTVFEAVTYFNATTYNISNSFSYQQQQHPLKYSNSSTFNSTYFPTTPLPAQGSVHLIQHTNNQDTNGTQITAINMNRKIEATAGIDLTLSPFPLEDSNITDLLSLKAYCGKIDDPGLSIELKIKSTKYSLLDFDKKLPFDVLSTSSMHGREFYYVLGAVYDRYGPSAQSISTQCTIEYQKAISKKDYQTIFSYNYTATVLSTLNSIQFTDFQFPSNEVTQTTMKYLQNNFVRLKILCPNVYHIDFWSSYETVSLSNLHTKPNPAPYPQTPKNIHFPSCFQYSIYEPFQFRSSLTLPSSSPSTSLLDTHDIDDSDDISNTYLPIDCGELFTLIRQTGKRVRIHAYKNNPNSYLYPPLSLIGIWVSEIEPYVFPKWALVIIICVSITFVLLIAYFLWKKYEKRREIHRRKQIVVTEGYDLEMEEELFGPLNDDLIFNRLQ